MSIHDAVMSLAQEVLLLLTLFLKMSSSNCENGFLSWRYLCGGWKIALRGDTPPYQLWQLQAKMGHAGRIVCLGDPVVDVLARTDAQWLETNNVTPGGCIPCSKAELDALLDNVQLSEAIER